MLENIPDAIYFKDEKSRFLRVSKHMLNLFGVSSYNDLLGKSD